MTDNDKDLIALAGFIVAAVAVIVTYLIYKFQKNAANRQRTIELHERYNGTDFYRDIRSPTWKIGAKWLYLPEPQNEAYKAVVAGGWIDYMEERNETTLQKWIPDFSLHDEPAKDHYLLKKKVDALTEHEILTIFLKYWSDLWIYIEHDLVSHNLCFIFYDDYRYHKKFIHELRENIKTAHQRLTGNKTPDWISNTENLEIFLEKCKRKT